MKCTPNIFLISVYVSLQQDIWCVKVNVLKNWKQLSLSVTYFVFIGAGVRYIFSFIPHLYNHEVPTKYTREKILDPRKYPLEKILNPRNTHEKNFLNPQNTHEKTFRTHEIPTRKISGPTEVRWYDGT